jgi:hypothetical protein
MTTMTCSGTQRALLALAITAAVAPASWAQTNNMHKLTVLGRNPQSAMHVPPLTNAKSLAKMMAIKRMPGDFRKAFELAGLGSIADGAIATLTSPSSVVAGGDCGTVDIPAGAVADCSVSKGATMEWMAYRRRVGKSERHDVTLFSSVEWAGRSAFKAFAFDVTTKDGYIERTYRFVLPKPCSNLALLSKVEKDTRPKTETFNLTPSVTANCDCANGKLSTTVRLSGAPAGLTRVRVMVDGAPAGELTAPTWSMNGDRAGSYTFQAEGTQNTNYVFTQSSIRVDQCGPAAKVAAQCSVRVTHVETKKGYDLQIDTSGSGTGSPNVPATVTVEVTGPNGVVGQPVTVGPDGKATVSIPHKKSEGTYTVKSTLNAPDTVIDCKRYGGPGNGCEATATDTIVAAPGKAALYVDALFGKERRQRPVSEYDLSPEQLAALGLTTATAGDAMFGQCSPLLGFKVGVAKRFRNNWEVAGDGGVAFNLSSGQLGNGVDKINPATLFADIEANKYLGNNAFIGTGITFWDLTRSETFTPAWLLHFGIPLNHSSDRPVYFIGEGRLFFDNIDSADNNYNFWGGIRVRFGKN